MTGRLKREGAGVATLLVIHGSEPGKRFTVDRPTVRVGRDSSNDIRLLDHEVSRQHAELRESDGGYDIIDLNSSNGTFVNGRRITEARLNSGDRLQIGQTAFLFGTGTTLARGDLARKISLITRTVPDQSGIVKSISQAEGSAYLARPERVDAPWLQNALAHLRVLYETSQAVSHIVDLDELLMRILELTFQSIAADRGCILLLDPETKQCECRAVHYRQGVSPEEQIEISSTIVEYVLATSEGVRTSDALADERFGPAESIMHAGIREAVCVPMQGRHGMTGVIYLDNRSTPAEVASSPSTTGRFTDEHLRLLVAIGHQAALAIEDTRYYQALVQSERLAAVGQTIATLSHHIKNILQGIKGGSHLVETGLGGHDEDLLRRGWNIVNKNQNKIYSLVMDMLTYSKDREPALETCQLNQVVSEVVELMEPRAADTGARLCLTLDEAMPPIAIDPEGIHRAVLNIVTNALDATEEKDGALVEVRTAYDAQNATACVHVRDNGTGIAHEELGHIFTLFASTKGARGTGIGLPVSEKIVREHGGRIRVQSQPGEGTEFVIEIPVRPEHLTMA
jgi:signal transduction histidine kinase/pSer/pThr/pTyr-binding forkhead associated (FHA) protein